MIMKKISKVKLINVVFLFLLSFTYHCSVGDPPPNTSTISSCNVEPVFSSCLEYIGADVQSNGAFMCTLAGGTIETNVYCTTTNCVGRCTLHAGTANENSKLYYSTGGFPFDAINAAADCAGQGAGSTFSATCN